MFPETYGSTEETKGKEKPGPATGPGAPWCSSPYRRSEKRRKKEEGKRKKEKGKRKKEKKRPVYIHSGPCLEPRLDRSYPCSTKDVSLKDSFASSSCAEVLLDLWIQNPKPLLVLGFNIPFSCLHHQQMSVSTPLLPHEDPRHHRRSCIKNLYIIELSSSQTALLSPTVLWPYGAP